ncbi:MAG TPA: PIN domain-containing protein [Gemmatimonadota bacterium]|nr:PIN domain-containing protein [Gemmatimonadota bacterium]
MADLEIHETPGDHWVRVGELRRGLIEKGHAISTPDAHVAQCALDRDAPLLTADRAFVRIARQIPLRLVDDT